MAISLIFSILLVFCCFNAGACTPSKGSEATTSPEFPKSQQTDQYMGIKYISYFNKYLTSEEQRNEPQASKLPEVPIEELDEDFEDFETHKLAKDKKYHSYLSVPADLQSEHTVAGGSAKDDEGSSEEGLVNFNSLYKALEKDGTWSNAMWSRILSKCYTRPWKPSVKKAQNDWIKLSDDNKEIINSNRGLSIKRTGTFELSSGEPRNLEVNIRCDSHNDICQSLISKFSVSIKLILENVFQSLVAPMAAQYPEVTSYPDLTRIDIRIEGPVNHQNDLSSFDFSDESDSSSQHRVIKIQLPYIKRLAQSHPKEFVWREIVATVTHEITHVFQWYSQRLGPKYAKDQSFISSLGIWPFAKPNTPRYDYSFRVPSSVPKELLEGIADYVVLKAGLQRAHWRRPTSSIELPSSWNLGTYQKAFFLEWIEMRIGEGTVGTLMGLVLDSGYVGSHEGEGLPCGIAFGTWETVTGMSVGDLWKEYGRSLDLAQSTKLTSGWTWAKFYFLLFVIAVGAIISRGSVWDHSVSWIKWKYR